MLDSIRWRLTLWYAAVLLTTLLVFGIGVERYFTATMQANRDAALRNVLDVLAGSLQHEVIEHGSALAGEASFAEVAPIHARTFPGYRWRVQREARVIGESGEPAAGPWPAAPGAYVFTNLPQDSRRAAAAVRLQGSPALYQLAAVDAQQEWIAAASLLRRTLLLAIPLVVLLSAFGGYALAVRSFAPVVAMADTARRLEARDLRERLPVTNQEDELGKLALTLNHLLDRISSVLRGQRDFMADAAHDLRTPVSIARTAAQTALQEPSSDGGPEREALSLIERQMARVSRMVADLLFLAKSDAGELRLRPEAYYLDELLRETATAARVLCLPKQLTLTVEADPETQASGDVHLLQQMLLILVENAIQHSPAHGMIRIDARIAGTRIHFRVADQGPGIRAEDRARVFDRFYRGAHGEGTGLGLAIASRIAAAHGGQLTLEESPVVSPSPSAGTVFRAEIAQTVRHTVRNTVRNTAG